MLAAGSHQGHLPPSLERQDKNKFHKQSKKSGHFNGNEAFQSQTKRDEECIWSGVSHEGAGVMYLPVLEEFKYFASVKVATFIILQSKNIEILK